MVDDLQAIKRVLAGDRESFRDLVQRYQQPLFRLVRNLAPAEAEDIVQEVFLAAYTHLASYDARKGSLATWLFTMARNRCWNALKKRKPRAMPQVPEGCDQRTPEAGALEKELLEQLDMALAALPFEQQTAFVLAEIEGLPLEEIARVEHVKLGTVKSRLSRAKDKLRALIRPAVEQP